MSDRLPITEAEFTARTRPALRLFLSVDLENSTQLKQRRDSNRETWLTAVLLFARSFQQLFKAELQKQALSAKREFPSPAPLWKMLGDELLFAQLLQRGQEAHIYLEAFLAALHQWNKDVSSGLADRGTLFVKGAAWIAGFPIANAVIDAGDGRPDYVGPSIDAGFRIARLATRRRLPISVDLAWLLLQTKSHLTLHFNGPAILKGMAEESGYPSFWLEVGSSPYVKIERELLGYGVQTDRSKMQLLCEHFITEFGVPRHVPFLEGDPDLSTKPDGFDADLQTHLKFLREIYIVDEPAPAAVTTPAAKHTAATPPPTEAALLAYLPVKHVEASPRPAPKKVPAPQKRPAPVKRRSPPPPKG